MTTVYLAVGHGLKDDGRFDPGAQGGGWTEQTAGDVIVARAAGRLEAAGIDVISEANADDPNFAGSVRAANAAQVDLVVAIHHDSATAPAGAFAYHYAGSTNGERIARSIIEAVKAAGFPTRNAWKGPGLGFADGPVTARSLAIVKGTRAPATLVEAGPVGGKDLDTVAELERFGDAVAAGVAAYFGRSLRPLPNARQPESVDPDAWAADAWARMLDLGVLSTSSRPHREVNDQRLAVFLERLVDLLVGMLADRDASIARLAAEIDAVRHDVAGFEVPDPPDIDLDEITSRVLGEIRNRLAD